MNRYLLIALFLTFSIFPSNSYANIEWEDVDLLPFKPTEKVNPFLITSMNFGYQLSLDELLDTSKFYFSGNSKIPLHRYLHDMRTERKKAGKPTDPYFFGPNMALNVPINKYSSIAIKRMLILGDPSTCKHNSEDEMNRKFIDAHKFFTLQLQQKYTPLKQFYDTEIDSNVLLEDIIKKIISSNNKLGYQIALIKPFLSNAFDRNDHIFNKILMHDSNIRKKFSAQIRDSYLSNETQEKLHKLILIHTLLNPTMPNSNWADFITSSFDIPFKFTYPISLGLAGDIAPFLSLDLGIEISPNFIATSVNDGFVEEDMPSKIYNYIVADKEFLNDNDIIVHLKPWIGLQYFPIEWVGISIGYCFYTYQMSLNSAYKNSVQKIFNYLDTDLPNDFKDEFYDWNFRDYTHTITFDININF